MMRKHEDCLIKSHEEESWREVIIEYLSIYLHVLTSRVENFELILDFNSLSQLKYLSWTSQLNSNIWVKNSDSNRVLMSRELDSISMTQLVMISLSKICYHVKMKRQLSIAFHLQTDDQTEWQNQMLKHYLRMYCFEKQDD